jgi:hypothetical protein
MALFLDSVEFQVDYGSMRVARLEAELGGDQEDDSLEGGQTSEAADLMAGLRPGGNALQAVADEATSFIDSALLCITQARQ